MRDLVRDSYVVRDQRKETKEMVGGKLNGVRGKTFFSLKILAKCKERANRSGEKFKGGEREGEGKGEGEREEAGEGKGEKDRFMEK